MQRALALASMLTLLSTQALAATTTYQIDPTHTYPSFEADHMGGLSTWRGKFNKTTGTITFNSFTKQGDVNVTIDVNSVDFGLDVMNTKAKSSDLLDTAKYPTATYVGKLAGFQDGKPTQVIGDLTLHGVTKPVPLEITSLKCMPHMQLKREVCGADARATFKRDDFGLDMGKFFGFKMDITLRIQVEAIAD
ncbi:MAG: polyisoprenoid-binding protein [Burkholderiales bacterium]|nr:polyisoprenoid-binding protein [Burkholderiales bacterium]